MWSQARIKCATGINQSSCVIASFIVKSHPPWQYDNNMGVYTHSCSNSTVFDLWLSRRALDLVRRFCVRACAAASRAHHRSRSRLKLNQSQSQAWFLWSHVPMGPLLVCIQYMHPVLHSVRLFACEFMCITLMCGLTFCVLVSLSLLIGCFGFRVLDVSISDGGDAEGLWSSSPRPP